MTGSALQPDIFSRLDTIEAELYGDLRARHATADLTKLRAKYSDDPIGFIRDVLHADMWDKQVDIATLIMKCPQVVVQSCNGAGKDHLSARLAIWAAAMGWFVIITGPTERQCKNVLMDDAFAAWSAATPSLPGEFLEMGWRIDRKKKGEGILAFTATDASRISGLHAPKLLAIMTEAQGVPGFAYEGIRSCLTGGNSRFLALGNPVAPEGEFYKICKSPGWVKVHIEADDCPNVKLGQDVIPGGISRKFVNDIRTDYGEESPVYRTRVLGLFSEQAAEGMLFPEAMRERAYKLWEEIARLDAAPEPVGHPVIGLDPARGADKSVFGVRRQFPESCVGRAGTRLITRVDEIVAEVTPDLMKLIGQVRVVAQRVGVAPGDAETAPRGAFVVDVVGLGGGVVDRLREKRFRTVAFDARATPDKKQKRTAVVFGNTRAAGYWRLHELMDAGLLALPRDDRLDEELAQTKYDVGSGKMMITPKDEIKKALNRSPDRADAVMLACWQGPGISGLGSKGQW